MKGTGTKGEGIHQGKDSSDHVGEVVNPTRCVSGRHKDTVKGEIPGGESLVQHVTGAGGSAGSKAGRTTRLTLGCECSWA